MIKEEIISKLNELTKHNHIKLTTRGNTAIKAAVSIVGGKVLIPEEGGWLEYKKIQCHETVKCNDAVINLDDLKAKLSNNNIKAFLYQNPGGYFAEQPMEKIYEICQQHNCLVILDVSGSIGTKLCYSNYADIIIGSFGRWKPINAEVGGFISCKDKELFSKLEDNELPEDSLLKIKEKLDDLNNRINFLKNKIKVIKEDLRAFNIVHKDDFSLVVVVKFSTEQEKEKLINYCKSNNLEWTECPRYIRLNKKAISIEVKRLTK